MTIAKIVCVFTFGISSLTAQLTRPERSNYEETSRYQDVMDFISALKSDGATLKLSWLGYSASGKHLPMLFYGDIPDTKPETVRKSGKVVVYIQANIHGGEVEGKEAMLELLRELSEGKHNQWRRRLIVMIVPIFNADGNDNISLYNRPFQHGPIAGMGQRANAQGLDLNRDHMKLETPEVRAFVKMLNAYDPHIVVDLHTTNGSFHGYHLTYSYALNPAIDTALDNFMRNGFMPAVEQNMRKQKWRVYRYGDYLESTPAGKPGYFYWAREGRYNTNYVGLRNRLAILSEAYSYIPFQQRIAATKAFVTVILDVANGNSQAIKTATRQADESAKYLQQFDSLSVTSETVESDSAQEILLAAVNEERNPYSGHMMYLMNEDSLRTIVTSEFYAVRAVKKAKIPAEYYVPDSLKNVLALLADHGVRYDTVKQEVQKSVQRFAISTIHEAEREFQKHRMKRYEGVYETVVLNIPAGTIRVPTNQRLSRLAFALLEPESEDGVVAWNVIDQYIGNGKFYPITKLVPEGGK
ncbi:MAG: M14 family metallopeptidase [Bacteroidota bacterium]